MGKSGTHVALFAVLLVASVILAVAGVIMAMAEPSTARNIVGVGLLIAGTLGAIVTVAGFAVVAQVSTLRDEQAKEWEQALGTLGERLSSISVLLNVVTEQQLISDRAKAVAFREKDREALRRAIREETAKGDWEAARVLASDMESTFGYRAEAEAVRVEIADMRARDMRRLMNEAQDRVDMYTRREDWAGALAEAARFTALYPEYEPGRLLAKSVEDRKQEHKRKLLDRWNEAVLKHDGDAGIEILKMLDPYLTPAEGERMAESARSIFNDRKAKLREQFTDAARKGEWKEAIRVGEVIQREFPNAKFAQEVRDMMDTLRQRAEEANRDPAVTFGVTE